MLGLDDRVKAISNSPKGHIGTIVYKQVSSNSLFLVQFDDWDDGHDGKGDHNVSRTNNGYFLFAWELELIEKAPIFSMKEP